MQYLIIAAFFGFCALFCLLILPLVRWLDEEQFYKEKTGQILKKDFGKSYKKSAVGLVNALVGQDYEKKLKLLLLRASMESTGTDIIILYSIASMVVALVAGILAFHDLGTLGMIVCVGLAIAGFKLPEVILSGRVEKRQRKIKGSLLQVVEALAITVSASKELQSAIQEVATIIPGPLTDEFRRTVGELRKKTRKEAFRDMGERIGLDDVRLLLEAIVQALDTGTPIADILRGQARRLRQDMRTRLSEKAGKASFGIVFPMMVFQVPSCLAIMMIPAVKSIIDIFQTTN